MVNTDAFLKAVQDGYSFKGETVRLGRAMLDGAVVPGADIFLPLKTMNRHGLIAGATGTGKTKTLQVISELLSDAGVPVLVMDIKGDLSGLAAKGETNAKIEERSNLLGIQFTPTAYPVELMRISEGEKGVKLRATVTEFGPVLLSKILELNDTQGGIVAMLFKYADDHHLPLLDIKDFKKLLQYSTEEGKAEMEREYGKISTASTGTILRKLIELEQQGANQFFGELSFDVHDLMRTTYDGKGMINVLRVTDLQDRPKLFSTFMLQLLAELYAVAPEAGDLAKPKLVMFIDEAHLVFQEANNALLQQIETVIKLIRSKGIGIFFCTQNPMDVPPEVLGQLGLKVQHALRAFTAKDRKAIRQTADNYPLSDFYQTDKLLTEVGIGEALVTALSEKGTPTPLVHLMLNPPQSRMDVLTDTEMDDLLSRSQLVNKYNKELDPESAYELLDAKITAAEEAAAEVREQEPKGRRRNEKEEPSTLEKMVDNPVVKSMMRTAGNQIVRSLLGSIGLKGATTRRKKTGWF